MFPVLEPQEIERVRRFGKVRSYGSGEALAKVGDVGHGLIIILRHRNTDIENWRPETHARNWSIAAQNPENYASETPRRLTNSRECRAYLCDPDMAHRDRTGWLRMQ